MLDQTASAAASRRIFRSKVDDLRPTYGFEDVSLAPGTETIEPADVELGQDVLRDCRSRSRSSRRRWTRWSTSGSPGSWRRLGGLAILNLEGVQTRYDEPDAVLERIAAAPDDEVHDLLAEAYAHADPRGAVARRIDEIHAAGLAGRGRRDAGAARRFGPFCAEHGADLFLVQSQVSQRPPPRHRLRPAVARGVHPVHADPGRGRQHDERRGGVRADGAGRRGGLRRRRAGRRVHDPRGPRDRRPAGHRDQRRCGRPRRLPRRDRPLRPGRRRRRHAPRRRAREGDRGRRRRR